MSVPDQERPAGSGPRLGQWVQLRHIPDPGRSRVTWLLVNRRDGTCLGLSSAEAAALTDLVAASAELIAELDDGGFLAGSPPGAGRGSARGWAAVRAALAELEIRTNKADRLTRLVYRSGARWLFHPVVAVLQIVVAVAGAVAVGHALLSSQHVQLRVGPEQVPLVILFGCLSVGVHEFAHALVVVHGGGRVDSAGVRLHLGTPAFYVQSIDSQLLGRRMRMIQAAAGAWAEWLLTSLAAIWLWSDALGPIAAGLLARYVLLNSANVCSNLLPFVKLDGHWLLADAVGQPDLSHQAAGAVRRLTTAVVLREPPGRSTWLLATYSAINTMVAVGLLALSSFIWYQLFAGVIADLCRHGLWGWIVLVIAGVVLGRPVVVAIRPRLSRAIEGARDLGSAVRFRREFAGRIEAVEALAVGDPVIARLDQQELGALAGRLIRCPAGYSLPPDDREPAFT
jgi:hypothetical protein